MSRVIILAGPNGAGKSTCAASVLRDLLQVDQFVNADTIAQGLSAFSPGNVAIEAGRIMLSRLDELAKTNSDFAFETTLASRSLAPRLQRLTAQGYEATIIFLWLPSPEAAVARVRERVRLGGHSVPEDVIRRRYQRGLDNFFTLYANLAHEWQLIDNSLRETTTNIAIGGKNQMTRVIQPTLWNQLVLEHGK